AALYACDVDRERMARTRDAVVLAVRAVREGFAVLRELGYPTTPGKFELFARAPEPLMVYLLRKLLTRDQMETALTKHAAVARDEVQHLADEFLALAARTHVRTPAILELYPHFELSYPLIPDGSAAIPLDWRGVWTSLAALSAGILAVHLLARRRRA
ncbi:MAG: hypothetical protein MUF84_19265, partial [Anaerolineae bacterium]|nr:hypothetical protein [Anaerolineae bacterium]